MSYETPILFLIFNRPDLTEKVFGQIRKIKPKYLFVAADGPRSSHPEDQEKCKQAREVVLEMIDWECEVKTLFRKENLGCGKGPYNAINWFFTQVEQGIILEDDILPDISFFEFCSSLLSLYKNDNRIMMISGLNVCGNWKEELQDYHFSYFGGVWGWATWKRAWKCYDYNIKFWDDNNIKNLILNIFPIEVRRKRKTLYDNLFYSDQNDIWDLQWTFSKILNSGLTVIPSTNLIKNIGIGKDATHTKVMHPWSDLEVKSLKFPLQVNNVIVPDLEYQKIHLGNSKRPYLNILLKYGLKLKKFGSLMD